MLYSVKLWQRFTQRKRFPLLSLSGVFKRSSSVAREAQQMFQMASYLCMYLTLILSFFRNRDYTRATAYSG